MVAASGIVPASENNLAIPESSLRAIITREGPAAIFAAEEFFYGKIRNAHTRRAYLHAARQFLAWCECQGLDLPRVAPKDVGQYFDVLQTLSVPTRKQHLAALRHFFDGLVTRHVMGPWRGKRRRLWKENVVGARGFEPPTPCAQGRCATRLRYAPTEPSL